MTAADILALKSRRPPCSARLKDAKRIIREGIPEHILACLSNKWVSTKQWNVRCLVSFCLQYASLLLHPPRLLSCNDWLRVQYAASEAWIAWKELMAHIRPYDAVARVQEAPEKFETFTAEELTEAINTKFDAAVVPMAFAAHYFYEHGCEVLLQYPYDIAVEVGCEESFEAVFPYLSHVVSTVITHHSKYEKWATDVLFASALAYLLGFTGRGQREDASAYQR